MKISLASNKENIFKKHSNLTEIFNEKNNISIWKRKLNSKLINASNHILNEIPELQISEVVKNERQNENHIIENINYDSGGLNSIWDD